MVQTRSISGVSPPFYKPFLPQFSTHRLELPLAFTRYMEGKLPSKAVLKDRYGNVWPVKIGEYEDEICFLDGWTGFITDNVMEAADLMVFQYDGKKTFGVKLLGLKTRCEKNGVGHRIGEENEEDDQTNNSNGAEPPPLKRRKKINTDPFGHSLFKDGPKPPENPYFITHIKIERNEVNFPKRVIRAHQLDLPAKVVICDSNGRIFNSRLVVRDGCSFYRGGWSDLCRVNLITVDDTCLCEFVTSAVGEAHLHVRVVDTSNLN